jgi:predicted RecB family nuclease
MASAGLSKSSYLAGLQCHKRLYLERHSPHLATDPDETAQPWMGIGTDVGILARHCFPGGVLLPVDDDQIPSNLQQTKQLIKDPTIPALFEAAFQADGVFTRTDVLRRRNRTRWQLIEVKSSTTVRDEHIHDLAIQGYILTRLGIKADYALMHINNQYIYQGGPMDLTQLFVVQDLTNEIKKALPHVPTHVNAMEKILRSTAAPAIEPGHHCHAPYECGFWSHCTEEKSERWIYYLPKNKRITNQLVQLGITTIDEIPNDFTLPKTHHLIRNNIEWIGPGLTTALQTISYPVHHLDFETLSPVIPKYPGTRPYQMVPFQWSDHVEYADGRIEHHEFLCTDSQDPRETLAEQLLQTLRKTGSICVYSSYEKQVLKELGNAIPRLKVRLDQAISRLWDLLQIIKAHYYHPAFRGYYSIKAVLPALIPSLSYEDLQIQAGGTAMTQFYRLAFEETNVKAKSQIESDLRAYCARDTSAMVEIRRALHAKIKNWDTR